MAQAILVKYLPPTNPKGGRVKASAWFGTLTIGYDHAQGPTENHTRAAYALCDKHSKSCALIWAQLPGNLGYAYFMSPNEEPLTKVKEP